ncbi:hypothetical protein AURDEDRAFT_170415 [Auricularia subglabra TFB-10046 SS5]|nr:hypothetical protein AURDEDRAFT_170415 [Auricularia subglabra TFB-10046 SS5]
MSCCFRSVPSPRPPTSPHKAYGALTPLNAPLTFAVVLLALSLHYEASRRRQDRPVLYFDDGEAQMSSSESDAARRVYLPQTLLMFVRQALPLTAITSDADDRPTDAAHPQPILSYAVRRSRSLPPSPSRQARRGGGGVIRAAGRLQARFLTHARARSPRRAPVVYDASFAYDPEERRGVGSVIGLDGTESRVDSTLESHAAWMPAHSKDRSRRRRANFMNGPAGHSSIIVQGYPLILHEWHRRASQGKSLGPRDSPVGAWRGEKRVAVKPPLLLAEQRGSVTGSIDVT